MLPQRLELCTTRMKTPPRTRLRSAARCPVRDLHPHVPACRAGAFLVEPTGRDCGARSCPERCLGYGPSETLFLHPRTSGPDANRTRHTGLAKASRLHWYMPARQTTIHHAAIRQWTGWELHPPHPACRAESPLRYMPAQDGDDGSCTRHSVVANDTRPYGTCVPGVGPAGAAPAASRMSSGRSADELRTRSVRRESHPHGSGWRPDALLVGHERMMRTTGIAPA